MQSFPLRVRAMDTAAAKDCHWAGDRQGGLRFFLAFLD
jgi:hypothetical protein